MPDYGEGDPKLYFTQNGADIKYTSGQPFMELGIENHALIALFTRAGWFGNVFLLPENRIGSDFEATCSGSITLSKLTDIENSAERALTGKTFPKVTAKVINKKSDHLFVEITIQGGTTLALSREGMLWRNQRERQTS